MRSIARNIGVSATTILRWIRGFAQENNVKPAPGSATVVEVDEMHHYVGKKNNRIWIWKALCRETGQLIDWECGGRDQETLQKLMDRLKKWDVELYCTDNFVVYEQVIDEKKLYQSKSQTYYIEQNNGRQRHWFARFRRRSIVVSKTIEMVYLTVALFARFHVNGCIEEIATLVK